MKRVSLRVGRDPICEVPVADETISRFHAEIQLTDDGRLFVMDTNSSNGTFVITSDGKRKITQATLEPGQQVQFGDVCFEGSDLVANIISRASFNGDRMTDPASGDATGDVKRVRCTVCGFVICEGGTCPRCSNER